MEKNEWINNLKPGDPVFIRTIRNFSYNDRSLTPTFIKTIGKLHIITEYALYCKCKFNRNTLEEAGKKWGRMYVRDPISYLVEYSIENIAEYELQKKRDLCNKVIKQLCYVDMRKQTPEAIETYYKILVQLKRDD